MVRLHIQFVSKAAMRRWLQGLSLVMQLYPDPLPNSTYQQWLIDIFQVGDRDASGTVEEEELPIVFSAANMRVKDDWIANRMQELDPTGTKTLNFRQVS